jgi:hypothetical protein
MTMAGATEPQPALQDDATGWDLAAYTAQLGAVRQDLAVIRREVITARASGGDGPAMRSVERRLADIGETLLASERKIDGGFSAAAAWRSIERAVLGRAEMPEPVPAAPVRPRRRRTGRRPAGHHAARKDVQLTLLGDSELNEAQECASPAAFAGPAVMSLGSLTGKLVSRHASAKALGGATVATATAASVVFATVHRADLEQPWYAHGNPPAGVVDADPLPSGAPLLARTFPAVYPGRHHKRATVTLSVPAAPALALAPDVSSWPSGSSQPDDPSQSSGWSQPSQQDQWQGWQHGGWQHDSGQGGSWQGWDQQPGGMVYRDHGHPGGDGGHDWQQGGQGGGWGR